MQDSARNLEYPEAEAEVLIEKASNGVLMKWRPELSQLIIAIEGNMNNNSFSGGLCKMSPQARTLLAFIWTIKANKAMAMIMNPRSSVDLFLQISIEKHMLD